MDFSEALQVLKSGERVRRAGWNGKGMFLFVIKSWVGQTYHDISYTYTLPHLHLPFIALKTADGAVVPWLASQTDLLAEDWEVAQ